MTKKHNRKIGDIADVNNGEVNAMTYSPDGTILISGSENGYISMFNCKDNMYLIKQIKLQNDTIGSLSFSPDSKEFISCSYDGTIIKFDRDGNVLDKSGVGNSNLCSVNCAGYSFDGKKIVIGDDNGMVSIFNSYTLNFNKIIKVSEHSVTVITCAPDKNEFICVSCEDIIYRFDLDTYKTINNPIDDLDIIYNIEYSPDGREFLVTSVGKYGNITRFDTRTGKQTGEVVRAHEEQINGLKYSPNGKEIVTISGDNYVKVWDASKLELIDIVAVGKNNAHSVVVYSPDGKEFIVAGEDGKLMRYKGNVLRNKEKKRDINEVGFDL